MTTLPAHIHTQKAPDAGTGLFASEAILPAVEVFRVERPLVLVLDSPHLKDTCSECCLWLPDNGHEGDPQSKKLKACHACKITKYCCKVCLFLLYSMPRIKPYLFEANVYIYFEKLSFVSLASYVRSLGPCGVLFVVQ